MSESATLRCCLPLNRVEFMDTGAVGWKERLHGCLRQNRSRGGLSFTHTGGMGFGSGWYWCWRFGNCSLLNISRPRVGNTTRPSSGWVGPLVSQMACVMIRAEAPHFGVDDGDICGWHYPPRVLSMTGLWVKTLSRHCGLVERIVWAPRGGVNRCYTNF